MTRFCIKEGCKKQPTFGKPGGSKKDAQYCLLHKPINYVNVVNKTCIHEGCKTLPTFSKPGGSGKYAEYFHI